MYWLLFIILYMYGLELSYNYQSSQESMHFSGVDSFRANYFINLGVRIYISDNDVISKDSTTIYVCPNTRVEIHLIPSFTVLNPNATRDSNLNNPPTTPTCIPGSSISQSGGAQVFLSNFCGILKYGPYNNPSYATVSMNANIKFKELEYNVLGLSQTVPFQNTITNSINVNSNINLNNQISLSVSKIGVKFWVTGYENTESASWCYLTNNGCGSSSNRVTFNQNLYIVPVNNIDDLVRAEITPSTINTNGSEIRTFNVRNLGSRTIVIKSISSNLPNVQILSGLNEVIQSGQSKDISISFSNSCQNTNTGQINIVYESQTPICGQNIQKNLIVNVVCNQLPDLTPTGQNNSYDPSTQTLGVTLNVSNIGSGSASNIRADVRNNKTNTWQQFNFPGTLNPGQIWGIFYTIPNCAPGERVRVEINVDPMNSIIESDETNNRIEYDLVCGYTCDLNPATSQMNKILNQEVQTSIKCGAENCVSIQISSLPAYLQFINQNPSLRFRLIDISNLPNTLNVDISAIGNDGKSYNCKYRIDFQGSNNMDPCRERI
ncbi:MAG: CARDB domain-containing protein [Candidatus Anstonellales archaeon]